MRPLRDDDDDDDDSGGGDYVAFLKRNESDEDTKREECFKLEGIMNKEGETGECGKGEREGDECLIKRKKRK